MNCVVFKLDERLHEKLIKFYKAYEINTPPYAKFAAKNYDVTITLYEKGKVMFQGVGAILRLVYGKVCNLNLLVNLWKIR